jgi:signal peptidase I
MVEQHTEDKPDRVSQSANAEGDQGQSGKSAIYETVVVIIQALLIALVFRAVAYHPFSIPSGSMMPTLLVGDYLFVSKFSYGYGRYSFYGDWSFIDGRIWAGEPERGDVAVFRPPTQPDTDFIKRVIGLPGDRIRVVDGVLHINGQPVEREPAGEFIGEDNFGRPMKVKQYRETLKNGVSYLTLDAVENSQGDNTELFVVPPGYYFMMGDNRDNSSDSRFEIGPIPAENLIGRAEITFFSVDEGARAWEFWKWPWTLRFSRFFRLL